MGGRSQIKANDLSGLGFKERIVALHVATHAVRAQPGAAPDASHPHMIKAKLLCQLARAPVGGSIAGRAAGAVQNTRRQGGALFVRRSAAVTGVKSSQPLGHKALLPAADVALPATQRSANGGIRLALCQAQDQFCPAGLLGSSRAGANTAVKFTTFRRSQAHNGR